MGIFDSIGSFFSENSETIHTVLDVAGFIPGVGAVADLANAAIYAAEGDWANAGWGAVALIPLVGDGLALLKKGGKAIGALDKASDLADLGKLDDLDDLGKLDDLDDLGKMDDLDLPDGTSGGKMKTDAEGVSGNSGKADDVKPENKNKKGESGSVPIPDEARDIAGQIKANNGAPPKGYKGGRRFENRDKKLPEGVNYKEYDIHPYEKGKNRGAERIVIGDDGSVWYTNDHYGSFTQIE